MAESLSDPLLEQKTFNLLKVISAVFRDSYAPERQELAQKVVTVCRRRGLESSLDGKLESSPLSERTSI
jgi:hypothetical protein